MGKILALATATLVMSCAATHAESLLKNESFEAFHIVKGAPTGDVGFGVWKLGSERQAPTHWTLNSAYPGECLVLSQGAHSGKRFVRVRATGKRGVAHIYQPCPAVKVGKWYRVSAWVRGGTVSLGFYAYYEKGPIRCPTILTATPGPDKWQQVSAYYMPTGDGFGGASLAIIVVKGESVDMDDVRVEEVKPPAVPDGLEPIVLENDFVRMKLSPQGMLEEFTCKKTGVNYAEQGSSVPMFRASRAGGDAPVHFIRRKGETLELHFLGPDVKSTLRLETRPHYFTIAVESVSGAEVNWLQLCDLRLQITQNVGTLINAAWNDQFGACVLACNDRTHSYGADGSRAALSAKCYQQFRMKGAKIAFFGVPTGPPDPASKLLDVIEEIEIEQGLPHPEINGVWIKRAPERFYSYLMSHSTSEQNIDQVVELAKGGFGCVEFYPWHSMPSYKIDPGQFPGGLAGLKKCADKIHAAGLQVGLHAMQGMVGWGGMHDPYVRPKADPRLLQDRHAALAAAVDAKATELTVKEHIANWPQKGDLFIEGEIVRYARRTETGFAECQRGLHGTQVTAHAAGAQIGHLVNCFEMWGSCIYAPDVNSTMIDEICDNIARVFNEVGADMSYFDGGEEIAVQPPHWRNQGRIALGVMQRLKKPVVLEGNALYTNLSWHVITRGSPSYDPIYYGRREYTLRAKGQNPANWAKNLLTGDVGWFAPHVHSLSTDAVTPDEVMLLCLKALGGKAPISFQLDANNPYTNKRMPEMLEIIRTCDELKRREYFSEEVCAELTKPMAEHVLEQTGDDEWAVRPLRFGPPRLLNAQRRGGNEWDYRNPYGEQTPWLRLRARTRLAPYGAKENLVLADFEKGIPFEPDGSASDQLVQAIEPSAEKTPDGSSTFRYRAYNKSRSRSGWCRLSLPFEPPLNLSIHRRVGVWVRAEGQGGILNVQLANTYGYRDHYIPLDFKGWSYRELDPPEDSRFYDYAWPYNFIDLMYWRFRYHEVTGLNLYYNALPPEAEVSCFVGRIEALKEYQLPLKSPALEVAGQRMVFPVSLKPDEYVELDWTGECRHFEPNGGLLEELTPGGTLHLAPGKNRVRFACEMSDAATNRAEVTIAVKGEPLENRTKRPPEPVKAEAQERDEGLKLIPDGKGGFRLLRGLYELVSGEPARTIPAFDGVANVWPVVNEKKEPRRAAIIIMRGRPVPDADYDDPDGILLDSFDDLSAYEMSETNRFEKYVIGSGKQLTKHGPVRAGVSQTFVPSSEGARVGRFCGVYTATNEGGRGGWCAKGKRFPKPLDLSKYEAVALWTHGDGKGETLRFQFRDTAGLHADWLVRIDFTGWRFLVFRTADRSNFNWKEAEYVIFYYNDMPAKTTCTMKFDDLKALPKLRKPPVLSRPELTVNAGRITLPVNVDVNEALTIDGAGRCTLWRHGVAKGESVKLEGGPLVLKPGGNRFELSCDTSKGAPRDVSVRVLRLGS